MKSQNARENSDVEKPPTCPGAPGTHHTVISGNFRVTHDTGCLLEHSPFKQEGQSEGMWKPKYFACIVPSGLGI